MPCGNKVCLTGTHRLQERAIVSWFEILAIVSCRYIRVIVTGEPRYQGVSLEQVLFSTQVQVFIGGKEIACMRFQPETWWCMVIPFITHAVMLQMWKDVGMARQKVCKQGRGDIEVKVYNALSLHLFTLQLYSSVKDVVSVSFEIAWKSSTH